MARRRAAASGITPIGGACGTHSGSGTITISYAPTAGNTVVIASSSTVTAPTGFDDGHSTVYAQLAVKSLTALNGYIGVPSGITSYSITGGSYDSACVEEYSGVVHFGSAPVQIQSGYGSTYTGTLASTTGTNNYFISSIGGNYNNTFTATAGTIRGQVSLSGGGSSTAVQDNTAAGSGVSLTTSGTISDVGYQYVAGIELKRQ